MKKTTIILIDGGEWNIFNAMQSIKNSLELLQQGKIQFLIATQRKSDALVQEVKPFKDMNVEIVSCEWCSRSKALNRAVEKATNEFICVMNDNTIIFKGFFDKMIEWLNDPLIWIVCPRFTQWKDARKGWLYYWKKNIDPDCFMFRKSDKEKMFPINSELYNRENHFFKNKIIEWWLNIKILRNCVCHHFKTYTAKECADTYCSDEYIEFAENKNRNIENIELKSNDPMVDLIF